MLKVDLYLILVISRFDLVQSKEFFVSFCVYNHIVQTLCQCDICEHVSTRTRS